MSRHLQLTASVLALLAAGPLGAQEASSLEAGIHTVRAHGDLLDIQAHL